MSLLSRITYLYDRIVEITGQDLEREEMLAFMLGYTHGERGIEPEGDGSWYKQGYKHGVLGDVTPGQRNE